MKRNASRIALIILYLAVALLALYIIGTHGSTGKGRSLVSIISSFGTASANISVVDPSTVETTFSASGVKNIEIDLVSADITFIEGNGSSISVSITSDLPDEYRPEAQVKGKSLVITNRQKVRNWPQHSNSVTVVMPQIAADISIDTVSGRADLTGAFGSMDFNTVSGSAVCDFTQAPSGKIKVDTVSGSFKANFRECPSHDISFNSVSGSSVLTFPAESGHTLSFSSVSGIAEDEFVGLKSGKSAEVTYGDGKIDIKAGTVSGNIKIKKD